MKTIPANEVLDPKKDLEKNQKKRKKEKKEEKKRSFSGPPHSFRKDCFLLQVNKKYNTSTLDTEHFI